MRLAAAATARAAAARTMTTGRYYRDDGGREALRLMAAMGDVDAYSPSAQRIRSPSTAVDSPARLRHRRRRLHRCRMAAGDSAYGQITASADGLSWPSSSDEGKYERVAVQCFVERKTIGSQDVVTIELPALRSGASQLIRPTEPCPRKRLGRRFR